MLSAGSRNFARSAEPIGEAENLVRRSAEFLSSERRSKHASKVREGVGKLIEEIEGDVDGLHCFGTECLLQGKARTRDDKLVPTCEDYTIRVLPRVYFHT